MSAQPTNADPRLAQEPAKPKKKKVKTIKVENGIEREVEIEVDDVEGLQWQPRETMTLLNHDLVRVDARDKLVGKARYTHDVRLPEMVYARLLLSPVPCAKVTVDVAPALKVPGVVGAIVIEDERTSYLGQPIAAVAATTPERAEDGLRAIALKVTAQPWSVDHATAIREDAPRVRSAKGNVDDPRTQGDEAAAKKQLGECAATIEATYELSVIHHACLETHGVVVDYRGGDEATVYCSTQSTFSFPGDAAKILGLPADRVTGIVEHMGGGFGSKFGLHASGEAACRLAKELKRPVHLMLTRADEFVAAGNRSGGVQKVALGADKDGVLQALVHEAWKHGGIGDGSLARMPYVYDVEGPRADGADKPPVTTYSAVRSVRMHMDSSVAMRAPGHPQASFAMESAIDELAAKLGVDQLEMRKKNLRGTKSDYGRLLDRVAREVGWHDHAYKTKHGPPDAQDCIGIGFAISTWGGGVNSSDTQVDVKIERDGGVVVRVGTQDLGTGTRTYVAAIVAEELGLPLEAVRAEIGNSRLGNAAGSGGSITTASLAPAVKDAAANARLALAAKLGAAMSVAGETLRFARGKVVHEAGGKRTEHEFAKACALLPAEGVKASGKWQPGLSASGVKCAQAAKVRVDTLTGRVDVLEMACMQQCGLPLNRRAIVSQINGGMIQAIGHALYEGRVIDPKVGLMLNPSLEDYKLPGSHEIPKLVVVIDDEDTRGVIGVGEPPIIPGPGAIANAIYNACGARLRSLPMTPDKVLAALGKVV